MDRLIKRFDCTADQALMMCDARGVAYQRDMTKGRQVYNNEYMAKVDAYLGNEIEQQCIAGRLDALCKHIPVGSDVLDYGCGSGAFVNALSTRGHNGFGFDLMPDSASRCRGMGKRKLNEFDVVTCWDTLEHMEDPGEFLMNIKRDAWLFISMPVFDRLQDITASKHYRPGEHLYYFTRSGLVDWMAMHELSLVESLDYEIKAGRENIGSFVFRKNLKSYRDFVGQYHEMHNVRYYGSSAVELHFKTAADVVLKVNPKSILDYGCGRSELACYFWNDGKRTITRYDPAIRKYNHLPHEKFDLVLCCDVMEHIPILFIDKVLTQIKARTTRCLFTISTKLARAKLPDGSNAHCTILTTWEWIRWLRSYFQHVHTLPSEWEHELILLGTEDKNW